MVQLSETTIRRLTSAAVLVGLFLIRPDAFLNPQFWAEDGRIFFQEALEHGAAALPRPFAGYIHALPRLGAWLASMGPLALAPAVFNFLAIVGTVFTAFKIMTPRWRAPFKPFLALSLLLVPQSGEVLLNMTNFHWFSGIWLLVLALQDNPSTGFQAAGDYLLLVLAGLTGPFVVIFIPLLLIRVRYRGASAYNLIFVLLALAAAGLQAWALVDTRYMAEMEPLASPRLWRRVVANRFTVSLFLGAGVRETSHAALSIAAMGLLVVYMVLSAAGSRRKVEIFSFLAAGMLIFLAVAVKFRSNPMSLVPFENGDRYFFLPRLMIMWSLIMTLEHASTVVRRASILFLAMIIVSGATWRLFSDVRYVDFQWRRHISRFEEGNYESLRLPINPPGWSLELRRPAPPGK
ncbi:MAG: hypothetical protein V1816_18030 [Pseudomonadota bacterium]